MAAAAAAVGSCLSATASLSSKLFPSNAILRAGILRASPTTPTRTNPVHHISLPPVVYKRRMIWAAVAHEEAAAAVEEKADDGSEAGEDAVAEAAAAVEEKADDGSEAEEDAVAEAAAAVEEKVEDVNEAEEDAVAAAPVTAQNTKLYFGNLPYNCDSAQLAGIIQEYASPEMVEVLYDRDTGRSRGFAFVTMSSVEDCEAVIQNLEGSQYGGRTLRVNMADKPKPKEPLYPESEHKLFVGNLGWSVTSESLTEVFREYGSVVGARVLYDGDTGRSRGYGFVCYSSKEEMEVAMESLNGTELEGRSMRISLALGKKS